MSRLHRCLHAAAERPVAACTPTHSVPRSRSSRIWRSSPSVSARNASMSSSSPPLGDASNLRSVAADSAARMTRRSRALFRAKSASTPRRMDSSRAHNRRERLAAQVGEPCSSARTPTVRSTTKVRRATEAKASLVSHCALRTDRRCRIRVRKIGSAARRSAAS